MKLGMLLWLASLMPGQAHEQACVAATVYLEARDQSALGQYAIAEVVLRRRSDGRWGKNACDVVMQRHQFATADTSNNYTVDNPKAFEHAWRTAGDALAIWNLPAPRRRSVVPGADHFYAVNSPAPDWAAGTPVAVIGDHSFFRVGL